MFGILLWTKSIENCKVLAKKLIEWILFPHIKKLYFLRKFIDEIIKNGYKGLKLTSIYVSIAGFEGKVLDEYTRRRLKKEHLVKTSIHVSAGEGVN